MTILAFLPVLAYSQYPIQKGIGVTVEVPGPSISPPPLPTGGGGGAPPPPPPAYAKVVFEGKAYPKALITISRNGQVAATVVGDPWGDFSLTLTAVPSGVSTFGIFAEDNKGRKSVTLGFTISILEGTVTTVKGIFISPTIDLSKKNIRRGEILDVLGQAYPQSEVQVFTSSLESALSIAKTISSAEGEWELSLDTAPFPLGSHATKAKAVTLEGEQSPFSEEMIFEVLEICKGADLNFDEKVNIVDFSILLYFWGQKKPANVCVDINRDGMVNIFDFSIMMYWWTG